MTKEKGGTSAEKIVKAKVTRALTSLPSMEMFQAKVSAVLEAPMKAKVEAVKALEAKAGTKGRNQDVKTLYDDRQLFVTQHGKAIAAEFAREPKGSWWNVGIALKALKLNYILVGYTLAKLGLIQTKEKNVVKLLEADKEFTKAISQPVMKKAAKLANSILGGMRAEVVQYRKLSGKEKSKALIAREKREAEAVKRFKATEAQVKA